MYLFKNSKVNSNKRSIRDMSFHHFRIISLVLYLVVILIFNIIIAPLIGVGGTVYGQTVIDANRLVYLANQDRAQAGLPSLTVDQRLINAATNKGIDMFKKQYWAHYGPNGETPWQFINAAGYTYTYAGENLAKDFTDTDSVNTAWMNSTTHRANILSSNYKNIGIAAVSGKQICNGTYPDFPDNTLNTCIDTVIVVQMFGTSVNSTTVPSTQTTQPPQTTAPQKTPTPKLTTTPKLTSTPPSAPEITDPTDGSYLNQNKIEVKGKSDNGTSVSIYEGDKKLGTVLSDGGAFDIKNVEFTEGLHIIKANAQRINDSSNLTSPYSSEVKINIDLQKPIYEKDNIKVQLNDNLTGEYAIQGVFSEDTVSVKANAGDENIDLQKQDGSNVYTGIILIKSGVSGIVLSAYDKAGNVYTSEIPIEKTPISNVLSEAIAEEKPAVNSVSTNSIKQRVNILVGVFVLIVFLVDSILVIRNGKLSIHLHHQHHPIRGSSIHHVVPIIIVLISLVISFSGTII